MAAGGLNPSFAQLRGAKIVPDVVSHLAPVSELLDVRVSYKEIEVTDGLSLRVAQTQETPHVELIGAGWTPYLWTLVMVDPDAPSPEDPKYRNFLHWVVVNIPGSTPPSQEIWETGKEVTPYMGPAPPAGTHRYVFLLFQQDSELDIGGIEQRPSFDVDAFAKEHGLGWPRAAAYYLAKHGDDLDYPKTQS